MASAHCVLPWDSSGSSHSDAEFVTFLVWMSWLQLLVPICQWADQAICFSKLFNSLRDTRPTWAFPEASHVHSGLASRRQQLPTRKTCKLPSNAPKLFMHKLLMLHSVSSIKGRVEGNFPKSKIQERKELPIPPPLLILYRYVFFCAFPPMKMDKNNYTKCTMGLGHLELNSFGFACKNNLKQEGTTWGELSLLHRGWSWNPGCQPNGLP